MKLKKFTKRLNKVIPGGAHTYSRGYDQFPSNAPEILSKGKGCYIYDNNNKKLLDYGMGLRAVNLGYANNQIDQAAYKEIKNGNTLTRPSMIELQAAELMTKIIKSADMVKFTKNGSTAVTAAVKLARAYTGKKIILRCIDHPFYSFDDWFIGSTIIKKGIPNETIKLTKTFKYNDLEGLKKIIKKYKKDISCLVVEPAANTCPSYEEGQNCNDCSLKSCKNKYKNKNHFLKKVQNLCKVNNIIFILDEMITGFRWSIGGAQSFYGLSPDLSTFGKAMANGFSLAAVTGKKKIMEMGSINKKGVERTFLLSTTHGAEMSALGAFVETIKFIKKNNVIKHNWNYGERLKKAFNKLAKNFGIEKNIYMDGIACSPFYICKDKELKNSNEFRTLFIQEMIKNGVFMPWVAICNSHNDKTFKVTQRALENTFKIYKKALASNPKKFIRGHIVKPVFRKYN
jgi:glutamate-1-semialdehyde 2,1-aminomutase